MLLRIALKQSAGPAERQRAFRDRKMRHVGIRVDPLASQVVSPFNKCWPLEALLRAAERRMVGRGLPRTRSPIDGFTRTTWRFFYRSVKTTHSNHR
jgi:hypothetical protein